MSQLPEFNFLICHIQIFSIFSLLYILLPSQFFLFLRHLSSFFQVPPTVFLFCSLFCLLVKNILYLSSPAGTYMTELCSGFSGYLDRQKIRLEIIRMHAYTHTHTPCHKNTVHLSLILCLCSTSISISPGQLVLSCHRTVSYVGLQICLNF